MKTTIEKEFNIVTCCVCGTDIPIQQELHKSLKETLRSFYCVNGHAQSYRKSVSDTLRERIDDISSQRDQAEKDLALAKAANIRLEKILKAKRKK